MVQTLDAGARVVAGRRLRLLHLAARLERLRTQASYQRHLTTRRRGAQASDASSVKLPKIKKY